MVCDFSKGNFQPTENFHSNLRFWLVLLFWNFHFRTSSFGITHCSIGRRFAAQTAKLSSGTGVILNSFNASLTALWRGFAVSSGTSVIAANSESKRVFSRSMMCRATSAQILASAGARDGNGLHEATHFLAVAPVAVIDAHRIPLVREFGGRDPFLDAVPDARLPEHLATVTAHLCTRRGSAETQSFEPGHGNTFVVKSFELKIQVVGCRSPRFGQLQ